MEKGNSKTDDGARKEESGRMIMNIKSLLGKKQKTVMERYLKFNPG
jgi:hypothetical protein